MSLQTMQQLLDEKVAKKAQKDFKEAVRAAKSILEPFFEPLRYSEYRQTNEQATVAEAFKKSTYIDNYGTLRLAYEMDVPASYVRLKQSEASKEFVDKVNALRTDLDELYDDVIGHEEE